MFQARGSVIETGSRKVRCKYIGPLVILKAVGPNQFLLMILDGLIYPIGFTNCTEDLQKYGARTRGYPQHETYKKCNRVLAQARFY